MCGPRAVNDIFRTAGIGLSRPTELAVLRARVLDRQSGVRRPFVLEHGRDSTAIRRRRY